MTDARARRFRWRLICASSQVNAVTGALFTSEVLQAVADEVGGPTL